MTTQPARPRALWGRGVGAILLALCLALMNVASASALVGSPAVVKTAAGTTSVAPTQGKAQGSGLWGYVGDIKTRQGDKVFNYDVEVSPTDGSVWVTDSAKVIYTSNSFVCSLSGGTMVSPTACYAGESRVMKFGLEAGADWATGQYRVDGGYAATPATGNAGVGANYADRADAKVTNGSDLPNGRFAGVRGLAFTKAGTPWAIDADFGLTAVATGGKGARILTPDLSGEGASFGQLTWPFGSAWANRYDPLAFDYAAGATRMGNGNIIITHQTAELLKEFTPDGTFVRTLYLHQPQGSAYASDAGYRSPYAIAADPANGDLLVGYIDPGKGNQSFIERIDPTSCTTEPTGNLPARSTRDRCAVKKTIGLGTLATGDDQTWATFAIAVEPRTGDIYVAQRSGLVSVFASDGTPRGKFTGFGGGAKDGQLATVRGLTFDARGFLYATVSEGVAAARVEIFARTPDPITGLNARYTDASKTSVDLSWDALATGVTRDAQAPVRDYVVEASTDGGATWKVLPTEAGTAASQRVTGLSADASYQFRLSAWNEAGNGDVAVAAPTLPPSAITVVKAGAGETTATSEDALIVGADDEIEFTYTVTNEGPSTVTDLQLTDSVIGAVTEVVTPGFDSTLQPGASVTFRAVGPVGAGEYTNTVTAHATSAGQPVTATDEWFGFGATSGLSVHKRGDGVAAPSQDAAHHVPAGTQVTFTYLITNEGNLPLAVHEVEDDMLGLIAPPEGFDGVLDAGASVEFTAAGPVGAGDYRNVVMVLGEDVAGEISATDAWFGVGDQVVTPTPTPTPTSPGTPTPTPTGPTVTPSVTPTGGPVTTPGHPGGGLPQTGGWVTLPMVALAGALVVLGALMLVAGTGRRRHG